jgi:hypothetical protein
MQRTVDHFHIDRDIESILYVLPRRYRLQSGWARLDNQYESAAQEDLGYMDVERALRAITDLSGSSPPTSKWIFQDLVRPIYYVVQENHSFFFNGFK